MTVSHSVEIASRAASSALSTQSCQVEALRSSSRAAVAGKFGQRTSIALASQAVGDKAHLGRRTAQSVDEQDARLASALETILVHAHDTSALVSIHDADRRGARKGPLLRELQDVQ